MNDRISLMCSRHGYATITYYQRIVRLRSVRFILFVVKGKALWSIFEARNYLCTYTSLANSKFRPIAPSLHYITALVIDSWI